MAVESTKVRVIFIVDFKKQYLINIISDVLKRVDSYFLFYSYPSEINVLAQSFTGRIIFWKDFKNAYLLLKKIKPDKVVFFELETLNQIALNTVAKSLGVKSIFCDHGIQEFSVSNTANSYSKVSLLSKISNKLGNVLNAGLTNVVKNRLFFNRTLIRSNEEIKQFLTSYKKIRLTHTIHSTRTIVKSVWSDPDTLITFCPFNLNYYHEIFKAKNYEEVVTGFPEFDEISQLLPTKKADNRAFIFIDQPYVNNGLYGWTVETKICALNRVRDKCESEGYKLYIKPHPRETSFWKKTSDFNLLSKTDFEELLPKTKYVLGFNSTLLLIFAACPAINVIIFREHPSGDKVSDFLVKEKVAQWFDPLTSFKEIKKTNLKRFEKTYLYKLDGHSKERLTSSILK